MDIKVEKIIRVVERKKKTGGVNGSKLKSLIFLRYLNGKILFP